MRVAVAVYTKHDAVYTALRDAMARHSPCGYIANVRHFHTIDELYAEVYEKRSEYEIFLIDNRDLCQEDNDTIMDIYQFHKSAHFIMLHGILEYEKTGGKVINEEKLNLSMNISGYFLPRHDILTIKTKAGLEEIYIKKIIYLSKIGRTVVFHINGRSITTYGQLKYYGEILYKHSFIRIHTGYIVNKKLIIKVIKNQVCMSDGSQLPLSKYRKKDFQKEMGDTCALRNLR